jgi:TPR repeat protein
MSPVLTESTTQFKQCEESDHSYIPTIDLHDHNYQSAKNIVIKTIQEYHSLNKTRVRFITGRGNHTNSNGERAILYKTFPKWMSDITIDHLIESYIQCNGFYLVILKSSDALEKELENTFFNTNAIKQDASDGDDEAQLILGLMYLDGEGVKKNINEALKWLTKSAEKGNVNAQLLLGKLYFDGVGVNVKKKDAKAFEWFCKAAEQGDVNAQLIVGHLLYEGKGVTKNANEAFKWFEEAAEQNEVNAQFIVSRMYFNGEGIHQSNKKASKWIRRAAENGHPDAQFILGRMYAKGEGVKRKNAEEAIKWFKKAADQGHLEAGIITEIYV